MSVKAWLCPPLAGKREQDLVAEAIASGWLAPAGPHLRAFEEALSTRLDNQAALGVASGTAALHLALHIGGVKAGDIVFCPTLTFAATAFPILYCGAIPWFVDVDPKTWNMCPDTLEQAIAECKAKGKKAKAIIWVAALGNPGDIDTIKNIAEREELLLIEDAAEALGSTYKGRPIGTYGHIAAFSFNGNKIITTSGGGLITSANKKWIEKAGLLSQQARIPGPDFIHNEMGFNYRLSNILAAIGLAQLEDLDSRIANHRANHETLKLALIDKGTEQYCPEGGFHNRWLSGFKFELKDDTRNPKRQITALLELGFEARPLWVPLHLLPPFEGAYSTLTGAAVMLHKTAITYPVLSRMKQREHQDEFISFISNL